MDKQTIAILAIIAAVALVLTLQQLRGSYSTNTKESIAEAETDIGPCNFVTFSYENCYKQDENFFRNENHFSIPMGHEKLLKEFGPKYEKHLQAYLAENDSGSHCENMSDANFVDTYRFIATMLSYGEADYFKKHQNFLECVHKGHIHKSTNARSANNTLSQSR